MVRVLIAGCGDVGIALGQRLAQSGDEVWGLRRRADAIPAPIRAVQADLTRPETLAPLRGPFDRVCYAAAAEGFSEEDYRRTYVEGVANLLRALSGGGHPVRRFVFVSSTGVYGQRDGQWVDETSPTAPGHFSGRCLLQGEHAVLDGPYPATIVRLGGIYGPGRRRLIEAVRRGDPCVEDPPVHTNRIHSDDCAGALQHLLTMTEPDAIYLAVDCEPAPQCEVMSWLAGELGVPPPRRVDAGTRGSPQRGNKRCSNRRLLATGYRFRYPTYREGYRAVLREGDA
jgi:nucleoside-diphosphate-sugar epimerase